MKVMFNIIISLFIIGLIFFLISCKNKKDGAVTNNSPIKPDNNIKNTQPKENIYHDLRQLAFNITPEQLKVPISKDSNKIYGVIMDWSLPPEGIATLVSFETGEASMYLSTGGGFIGGGQHENVKEVVKKYIALAQKYFDKTSKTDTTLLPDKDCVKFYLLTNKGKFVAQEKMINIENESSDWLELFEEANKVITVLRDISPKK